MKPLPRVARLSVTPIKGLQLHHPSAVEVTADGVTGDRQFYLVDAAGKLQSCTHNKALLELSAEYDVPQRTLSVSRGSDLLHSAVVDSGDEVEVDLHGLRAVRATAVGRSWSDFFSEVVGKPVWLLRAHAPAYDVHPVTLLGSESVAELARQAGLPEVDARRFRMLVGFTGGTPHVEDSWAGRTLTVGGAVLRGGGLVKRCAATTRNPESGDVDLQTLRMITGYRGRQETVLGPGAAFGVYADVLTPGRIAVGDAISVD